ncbi:predicted protein [Nematostella vectensis]|uniref:Uncharacterized protein n=1 Tax=Nematostella vectensis TaxID=45351 RepID=A7S4E4_NEMVE|nr:predicted protein [Nematostella vectensis]|eukprot:XP_001633464.1 predicted protein [Nematostella vectensis]
MACQNAKMRTSKWILLDGAPGTVDSRSLFEDFLDVLDGNVKKITIILFRDPETFRAGELHKHYSAWVAILYDNEKAKYPPEKDFDNQASCGDFTHFISKTLEERLQTGAVRMWGKFGEVPAPNLLLLLTVEPLKPRLCVDARFLNLWMRDTPFSLDTFKDVPRYISLDSRMSKIDDKSGYDHVSLTDESMQYFGIRWGDWWLVRATLPFGWGELAICISDNRLGSDELF